MSEEIKSLNFLEHIIEEDLTNGMSNNMLRFRFPPEPATQFFDARPVRFAAVFARRVADSRCRRWRVEPGRTPTRTRHRGRVRQHCRESFPLAVGQMGEPCVVNHSVMST